MDSAAVQAPTDTAWRVTAEAIVCALLPWVRRGQPAVRGSGWALARTPGPRVLELRADHIGPGYVICGETAEMGKKWPPQTFAGIDGNMGGGTGSATTPEGARTAHSVKKEAATQVYRVPIAAFRHCGQPGMPVYFGYASLDDAESFSSQAAVKVRQGSAHPVCPSHAGKPVAYLADVMRDYLRLLWQACGCDGVQVLLHPSWTASEPEFAGTLAGRHLPHALTEAVAIAEAAGMVRVERGVTGQTRTGLLPAGAIWWAANQRLANEELIAAANLYLGDTFNIEDTAAGEPEPGSQDAVQADWHAAEIVKPGLVPELIVLREHLQRDWRDPYVAAAAGAVAEAEIAAGIGDSVTVRVALGRAGKQALQVAQATGLHVAEAAIITALGMS